MSRQLIFIAPGNGTWSVRGLFCSFLVPFLILSSASDPSEWACPHDLLFLSFSLTLTRGPSHDLNPCLHEHLPHLSLREGHIQDSSCQPDLLPGKCAAAFWKVEFPQQTPSCVSLQHDLLVTWPSPLKPHPCISFAYSPTANTAGPYVGPRAGEWVPTKGPFQE